jgi:two-component system, cell cycle sensor histidine kinase and response regulator CckA
VMTCGLSYMEDLDADTPLSASDVRECLADMRVAATTAADLTARLGVLIRRGEHALHERVSVSELCHEVIVLLTRIFPKSIVVESAIEPNLVVDGCRAWLHQLLMNPCINARDALAEGGVLRIEARTATAHEVAAHRELGAGPHLLLEISDSGAGMAPEVVAQAFDPLFTTKGAGSGTGLGLATVARVAREHGGAVVLQSTLGKGSSVRILLPLNSADDLVPSERPTLDPKALAKPGTKMTQRVLLVDDDSAIVRSVARALTRFGHDVVEAADGFQALDQFQRLPRPDVVVMDVDMPGMNGSECFAQLRTLDPRVKVVFISGYADADIEARLRSEGARAFLHKPLALDQLASAITSAARPSGSPPA